MISTENKDFSFDIQYIKGINSFNEKAKAPKPTKTMTEILREKEKDFDRDYYKR